MLTCRLEGAWQQADVIHAEAGLSCITVEAEAGHLVQHWDAAPKAVLEQKIHFVHALFL